MIYKAVSQSVCSNLSSTKTSNSSRNSSREVEKASYYSLLDADVTNKNSGYHELASGAFFEGILDTQLDTAGPRNKDTGRIIDFGQCWS